MTVGGSTAEALQRFLDAVEPGLGATVLSVTPLSGGYSRETTIGEVAWRDGGTQRLVLRRDPPDVGVFVSDRDQEWALLQALARTGPVEVPRARWYDAGGDFFGAKCIIGDFYPSRSLQELAGQGQDLGQLRDAFVDAMVDIHRTPIEHLPAELPHPSDWDKYIDSLIDLIDRLSHNDRESRPALRYAAARLRLFRPQPVPLTLVHGDCQPGNVLLGEAGPKVIDWEFGRIGDPREDIGYYSQLPVPPNLYQTDPEAFLNRYRQDTGLTEAQLNSDVVDYFYLLGLARLYGQMIEAADAVADGHPRGIMATYLINSISDAYIAYLEICRRLGSSAVPPSTRKPPKPSASARQDEPT